MAEKWKLNLENADVKLGGIDVTTPMKFNWTPSVKPANTVRRGKVVSRGTAKEITKFKLELEQWECGELEKELREDDGPKKGNLVGVKTTLDIVDDLGRKFSSKEIEIHKNDINWDNEDSKDTTTIEGEILDDYEADIHGGNA